MNASGKNINARVTNAAMVIAMAAMLLPIGCSGIMVNDAKSTTGRAPQIAEVPDADETVRGDTDPPIVTLGLGTQLSERSVTRRDDLPGEVLIPSTNLRSVPVTTALQAVLSGTDVSLSWEAKTFDKRLVTVTNLNGPLPKVIDKICALARLFCPYRNGILELKETETFVVELPSSPDSASENVTAITSMSDTIGDLVGDKVRLDNQAGNLVYTADFETHEKVREYLDQLRNRRPMIVMQMHIWEVKLNKKSATGINWKNFKLNNIGGASQSLLLSGASGFGGLSDIANINKTSGVGIGAAFSGNVDADTVLEFISEHGQVQTISNPQVTFVSGGKAEFRVGGEERYISDVGQITSGNTSGSNSTSVGSNTISTDTIKTGLTVAVSGAFENGVVAAAFNLELQDVTDLNPTVTGGLTINLPITTERKVNTTVRVRPGDNLVMAGLVSSRDVNKRQGLPNPFTGGTIPAHETDDIENTELVILVRPSVILFADSDEAKAAAKGGDKKTGDASAVIIDKDGARALAPNDVMTHYFAKSEEQYFDSVEPDAILNRPIVMPTPQRPPLPIAPFRFNESDIVDKSLLQSGFVQAVREAEASARTTSPSTIPPNQPVITPSNILDKTGESTK